MTKIKTNYNSNPHPYHKQRIVKTLCVKFLHFSRFECLFWFPGFLGFWYVRTPQNPWKPHGLNRPGSDQPVRDPDGPNPSGFRGFRGVRTYRKPWKPGNQTGHSRKKERKIPSVSCFVLLTRYDWGIVTVPGSFLFRGPGAAGNSPFTLTTSLVTLVPSSSSNGPTTTTLTTRGRACVLASRSPSGGQVQSSFILIGEIPT